MLRISIVLWLVIVLSINVFAQEKAAIPATNTPTTTPPFRQEIRLGVGYYTYPLVSEIRFAKDKERDLFMAEKPQSKGVYALSFFGFVNKEWNIGIHLAVENLSGSISKRVFDTSLKDSLTAATNYKVRAISIFPTAYKYWKQSGWVNMYSGIGLGIALKSYDLSGNLNIDRTEDTRIDFSFQVTALGIRLGKQYAGFAELGFGNLGILHVGFSAGF